MPDLFMKKSIVERGYQACRSSLSAFAGLASIVLVGLPDRKLVGGAISLNLNIVSYGNRFVFDVCKAIK